MKPTSDDAKKQTREAAIKQFIDAAKFLDKMDLPRPRYVMISKRNFLLLGGTEEAWAKLQEEAGEENEPAE